MGEYLVPLLLVAFIVVINIALWTSFSGKTTSKDTEKWKKISRSIQNPFEKEDNSLKELSERVSRLKQKSMDSTESLESDGNDQP